MKSFPILLSIIISCSLSYAQESADPGKTAKTYIQQGDYTNAILVLNRALQSDRENLGMKKDLALAYYLQRDFSRSLNVIKPIVESGFADVQSYQILGMVYKATDERKEAEKMYRNAIRRFPDSGPLYSEYGEMLWSSSDFTEASKQWLKGIEVDPNYPGNYYNAAKYYYMSANKVWGLIYGEIFINLESYSRRTPEIKSLLLEGYKKLFAETNLTKNEDMRNDFVKAYLNTMKDQAQVISSGVTPEALSALRTRFVLEWYSKYSMELPYRLFDYHRQLAKEGLFDAYNQWIFGAANDLTSFQQWTVTHSDEYTRFNSFQKNRVFKVPEEQFYQGIK